MRSIKDALVKMAVKFWEDNKVKITEGLKAVIRNFVFLVVSWLSSYLLTLPQTTTTLAVYAVLTWLDKVLHEAWKENDRTGLRGLFPL